jgi:DNA-binding MarR family transcriptional regulator
MSDEAEAGGIHPDDAQAAAELAAILRPSLLRLTRTIRNQRVDESVTLTLLAALMTLDHRGPLSPGELAALERVQPPSMTKILVKLEEKGLIARTPHPTDRRQVVVVATDAGRALLAQERQERNAWLSTRLATITPAERELLARVAPLLDKLAAP